MADNTTRDAVPVIPLPNEGEGGPVYSGNSNTGATPVIPLPNVGEGGPVYPGSSSTGTITVTYPSLPQYQTAAAAVRFLNASGGYPTFQVYIDGVRAVTMLSEGAATHYLRLRAGRRLISIRGLDGYTYIEKTLSFTASTTSTVAVTNRPGGLDLIRITDPCQVV